jgi:hypothetical protein
VSQQFTITASAGPLPQIVNVHVYHHDTWALVFTLQDSAPAAGYTTPPSDPPAPTAPVIHDLTGATAAAAVEDPTGAITSLVATIATDPTTGVVSVGPPAGGLTPSRYEYDVQVTEGSSITTWVHGVMTVQADITPP